MGSDVVIFRFRSDLRVGDNLALLEACAQEIETRWHLPATKWLRTFKPLER